MNQPQALQQPQPKPPHHQEELEQLREIVEVQNRTIRHLLENYNALLDKVEKEHDGGP